MPKKKISESARLRLALAANRARPLLDAIVRLETEAKERILDNTDFIQEMEGITECDHYLLVEEWYQKALKKAQQRWRTDSSMVLDEEELQEQLEALS